MITIKNREGYVIYSSETAANTRDAVFEAVSQGVDLCYADLRKARLDWLELPGARLRGTDLSEAYLHSTCLYRADLRHTNLRNANLCRADFSYSDLTGANLLDACLHGAIFKTAKNIPELVTWQTSITPPNIPLRGWKKCRHNVIVELEIPAAAKRSNATSRKCRAEYARVVAVHGDDVGVSLYDVNIVYRPGEIVRSNGFDDNRFNECAPGIHFFLTRKEAENYDV